MFSVKAYFVADPRFDWALMGGQSGLQLQNKNEFIQRQGFEAPQALQGRTIH